MKNYTWKKYIVDIRFNCKNLLYTKLFYKIKNKISLTTKGNNKMNILINGSGAVGLGLGASMLSEKADVSFYATGKTAAGGYAAAGGEK